MTARTDDIESPIAPQPLLRRLPELPRRLVLAAFIVALVMVPIGLFLSVIGIALLNAFGGAANDTSMVVVITAYVVTDFWGGGFLQALTKARSSQVTFAWGIARGVLLVLIALAVTRYALLLPVQFLLALPAAWAGARASRKQAQLRAQVRLQRAAHDRERAAAHAVENARIEATIEADRVVSARADRPGAARVDRP